MSEFKEFQGKTLDAAIAEACAYYDAPREKLEIDIVEDAKTGIFGLVGARKARIRARRAQLPGLGGRAKGRRSSEPADVPQTAKMGVDSASGRDESLPAVEPDTPGESESPAPRKERRADKPAPRGRRQTAENPDSSSDREDVSPTREVLDGAATPQVSADSVAAEVTARESRRGRAPRPPRPANREAEDTPGDKNDDNGHDAEVDSGLPRVALADLDQDKLVRVTTDMVSGLVFPIVGEVPLDVSVGDDRVQVRVDCEDTGLLIGREGQNLAAVQYLAARMVTHAVGAQVRVQVDAGDYHSRQDSRLQELARSLADKVRATGKSQSTRPLSAYQRRVIHLTLQDDPDVQTRSSGEGALKRVVVLRRKD